MNPDLLKLIQAWRERHREFWPNSVGVFNDRFAVNEADDNDLAIVVIEGAVMDWIGTNEDNCFSFQKTGPCWYVSRWDDSGLSDITMFAPTRLHALLLAVNESEAGR